MNNTPMTWRARDGRVLRVSSMETDHIVNALHMLQRNARVHLLQHSFSALGYACSSNTPDGAAMAAESEADDMMEQAHDPEACLKYAIRSDLRADEMNRELKKRDALSLFHPALWREPPCAS